MRLQVYDREVMTPSQRFQKKRDLTIGTIAPEKADRLGKQLEQMGTEIARKVKAAEQTMEYSKVVAQAKKEMASFYSVRSRQTRDHATLTADTDEHFTSLRDELLKDVQDVDQQVRIAQGLEQIGVGYHSQAIGDATKQAIDGVMADHVSARAYMIQDGASQGDEYMATKMYEYSQMNRILVKAGIMGDEEAQKDTFAFANDLVRGHVRHLMNNDPYAAQEYLITNDRALKLLEPESREKLLKQTDMLIRQKEEREERERRRIEKMRDDAMTKERDTTYQRSIYEIRNNTFSEELLNQRMDAGLYHKSDYDALLKAWMNRNIEFVGDPEIYQSMLDRTYMGEMNHREVMVALADEQINNKMADKLWDEIAKGGTLVRTEEYKTTLTALKTYLGWSPNMPGINPKTQQLIANATIQFRERALAGEDLDEVYADMIKRFSSTQSHKMEKPRYKNRGEAMEKLGPGKQFDREMELQRFFYENQALQNSGAVTSE